jgi:alanine racemase
VKSWIEISAARLAHNLHAVQAAVGAETEVLAVVKANGYGHDAVIAAQALVAAGARWLGVSDVEEGARVRRTVGAAPSILVMCGMETEDAPALVAYNLTPVIWTVEHVAAMEHAAQQAGQRVRVHLEIDTGMSRQGAIPGEDTTRVVAALQSSPWVLCEGVMSHLSSSEEAQSPATTAQLARFANVDFEHNPQSDWLPLLPQIVHLANTSAVDEGSTLQRMQLLAQHLSARVMVRTGLALYGHALPLEHASGLGSLAPDLQPALTWKTRIVDLRHIPAGATVGYGATFTATAPMRLALLPVGYADGLRREASSGLGDGWVCIAGQRAAVVGRVSMNLTVVDVTHIPSAALGDEAILLGEGVTAEDHARWCGTIPYEILCGIRAHARLV